MREGAEIVDAEGTPIGQVTSGGFGPSLGAPVAAACRQASPLVAFLCKALDLPW